MAKSEFELHPDRLSTTDQEGRRLFLYPADVRGFFRTQRTRVQGALIAVFLFLPWVRIQGRQSLLLDIAQRRFEIFGLSLRAHNAPLLLLVFATAAFGLFFATALYGRVWCGWACPQTVFIDGVFRRIERWVEGAARERRQLAKAPMSARKALKIILKWFLYVVCSLVLTHSFLAYFVGTDRLWEMTTLAPSENWGSFLFMALSTAVILFDFAWFREQFCTILCPYGRFQSVLMDKGSMIVSYDTSRGEPRATTGDCVNCYRCVQVCPTGIDIRRGVQMECIACTGCIDACNEVMEKVKKPKGLIRYDTLLAMEKKVRRFSWRPVLYLTLCLSSLSALGAIVYFSKPVDVEVLRAKDIPYTTQTTENGTIVVINHFKLELSNQSGEAQELLFELPDLSIQNEMQLITAMQPLSLPEGKLTQVDIFVRFPKTLLTNGIAKTKLFVKNKNSKSDSLFEVQKEVILVGPF